MQLQGATKEELQKFETELSQAYQALKEEKLSLNLTRGKPSTAQVSIADKLDGILDGNYISESGIDTRNYGTPRGLPEMQALGGEILACPAANIIAAGNSSLTLMFFAALTQYNKGAGGEDNAWKNITTPKFICPVPGYDRHFSICEDLGIQMVTAPMTETGPDMDVVEEMVKNDDQIIGIWCVPKYSNPTGVIYSEETVMRIAKLGQIANPSFRVFWDNAYAVHDLTPTPKPLTSLWDCAVKHGTEDHIWMFASSSKISFAGGGIAWVASSDKNLSALDKQLIVTTIGFDKVNQLRHAKLFPNEAALRKQMEAHANSIRPKFSAVFDALNKELKEFGFWTQADGGYFCSFDTQPGLAKEVVKLAAEAGVKLTRAGATFPYGNDPEDKNIRLAPTFPELEDVIKAMQVFCVCVKLASVRQLLET